MPNVKCITRNLSKKKTEANHHSKFHSNAAVSILIHLQTTTSKIFIETGETNDNEKHFFRLFCNTQIVRHVSNKTQLICSFIFYISSMKYYVFSRMQKIICKYISLLWHCIRNGCQCSTKFKKITKQIQVT